MSFEFADEFSRPWFVMVPGAVTGHYSLWPKREKAISGLIHRMAAFSLEFAVL
jgi:hypothetical protein